MSKSLALSRFNKLVDDISNLYLKTREMQVKFAWETGRRIVEEEQNGALRARYGSGLIPALSEELTKKYGSGFSTRTLERMRHFYRLHPISSAPTKLDWTDYVELLPVRDDKTRERLEQRAHKEGLNSRQLRQIVKNVHADPADKTPPQTPLKRPVDLTLNTFCLSPLRVKLPDNQVLVDCGFFVSWPVAKEELKNLNITDKPSYTYSATIDRVVDGDTLLVLIEVGFGIIVRDKLRLRGVNTPELGTPEGDKAKRFVEKILPAGTNIIVKTHKSATDMYGRFVADVFYKAGTGDWSLGTGKANAEISGPEFVASELTYLNQELLDNDLAVRMEA